MIDPAVYVVLLNWNGWQDTVACLASLFAAGDSRLRVVVCDNDSADGSLDAIAGWAAGTVDPSQPAHPRLSRLLRGTRRPCPVERIDRATAESGSYHSNAPLLLVDNGANLGFAAGNNVGLRYALAQPGMTHVWLLNNDTLVEPDCLGHMLRRLQQQRGPGVCGSMIHFFDQPERIQAIGGNRFNVFTGSAACSEGRFLHEGEAPNVTALERSLDYLSGCSILMPREFLQTVGLMSEDFFLYYEEIDWFTRAAGRFPICIAADAIIYHREGSSIGSPGWQRAPSALSDFHVFRSRLIFMRKHYRRWLALCYAHIGAQVIRRVLAGQLRSAAVIGSVLLGRTRFGNPQ